MLALATTCIILGIAGIALVQKATSEFSTLSGRGGADKTWDQIDEDYRALSLSSKLLGWRDDPTFITARNLPGGGVLIELRGLRFLFFLSASLAILGIVIGVMALNRDQSGWSWRR